MDKNLKVELWADTKNLKPLGADKKLENWFLESVPCVLSNESPLPPSPPQEAKLTPANVNDKDIPKL